MQPVFKRLSVPLLKIVEKDIILLKNGEREKQKTKSDLIVD